MPQKSPLAPLRKGGNQRQLQRQLFRLTLLIAVAFSIAPTAQAAESEYAIKAAYLYKFGFFVEWPSASFASSSSAINLCVVGDDPFGPVLDEAVNGQKIGSRPITVRRLKTVGRDSGCHIVYASNNPAQLVESLRGNGALIVAEGRGGIINFVIKDNRVRFDIDDEAAAQNGLTISSKLLSLAVNVKPRR
ncbi:YfiR family protein [Andreprevotia chitinilytica]|uniref:YfiR family protein n=1 Tax=Andreprevotia chitinilytica TaxID=396808 RepID=UPI00068BB87C|nr:YfiR family protein [Andreprevotia chitinilytica]